MKNYDEHTPTAFCVRRFSSTLLSEVFHFCVNAFLVAIDGIVSLHYSEPSGFSFSKPYTVEQCAYILLILHHYSIIKRLRILFEKGGKV